MGAFAFVNVIAKAKSKKKTKTRTHTGTMTKVMIEDQESTTVTDESMIGCGRCKIPRYLYHTILIVLIEICLFADQDLLAPVLSPVAREFGFVERHPNGSVVFEFDEDLGKMVEVVDAQMRDEKLGGMITIMFFLVGGCVSLLVGILADFLPRVKTLAIVVVLGETACLATYFTTTYEGLLITRALTGISVGGAAPLVFSLFGDLFSVKHRGKAIAAAGMAVGAGSGLGNILSGPIAGKEGKNWRLSFLVVAVPSYFLALLLVLTVKEPPRGTKEEAMIQSNEESLEDKEEQAVGSEVYAGKVSWAAFKELLYTRTVVLTYMQGIFGTLPWGLFGLFFADFLAEEMEIDIRLTGTVLISLGFGVMIGAILSGILVDRLFDHRKRFIPVILGTMSILGAIPMAIFVSLPPIDLGYIYLFTIPTGFFLGFAGNSTKVILVNVTVPESRGTAFSILNLADNVGRGLGGFILAKLFAAFETTPGGRTARSKGMQAGFLIGWVACGLFITLMYFTIDRDYEEAQRRVKSRIQR